MAYPGLYNVAANVRVTAEDSGVSIVGPAGTPLLSSQYAPTVIGVSSEHIYEAMLTGPQQMPVFSDKVLKPEEKREVIAYIKSLHL